MIDSSFDGGVAESRNAPVAPGEVQGSRPAPAVVCELTREEVGLAIDAVAMLVRPDRASEYRPLLHKLQAFYRLATTNPGTDAALEQGCRCPVLDNSHGRGYLGGIEDENGKAMFVVNYECPLHGSHGASGEGVVTEDHLV